MFNRFGDRFRSDRPKDAGYWQNTFIRSNAEVLGYYAWSGFDSFGCGLVVCRVEPPTLPITPIYSWRFKVQFIPQYAIQSCLAEFGIEESAVPLLAQAIERYDPYRDMMLLIQAGQQVEVNWIRNFNLSPPECYRQVCDRWEEFFPCSLLPESSELS
jgi:hypothetical protein